MAGVLDHLRVVLVAARNPLNIGAAARAMSNFGVMRLRVVNPYEVAFQEARSAVGAAGLLAKAEQFETVAEAIADCRLVVGTTAAGPRDLQHRLLRLEEGARAIKRQLKAGSGGSAFWFGALRPVEQRDEPLPLGHADSNARSAWFDEPGAGGCSLPV